MGKVATWSIVAVAALAAAFAAGYWPEHRQRRALEQQLRALDARVAELEARVRLARLLGDLLFLTETVTAMNYGEAQALSTRLFDDVSAELPRTPVAAFKAALAEVARHRDSVTASLARGEPAALGPLARAQLALRQALGYPVPSQPVPAPPALP